MNLTISQQDLDSFKRQFPNDPDIQAITLDQLRTYAQSVDPTVPPAQRPHQIKRVTFSPCDTAIATLIWDCICIVGDIMPIRELLAVDGVLRISRRSAAGLAARACVL